MAAVEKEYEKAALPSYSQIACVGTGFSAIALGATLKRWYKMNDIRFFERHSDSGGTWHISSYPGCACDVPSALYSFSFAPNPKWTKLMPSYKEIKEYLDRVVEEYDLRQKMTFRTEVQECIWREDASRWSMVLRNVDTGERLHHECQVLFAATGQLVEPRPVDIPGASSFKGEMFHSAKWNHDVSLEDKNVIIVGNGCTAAQIVPSILPCVRSLTQIVRSKHWVFPAANFTYGPVLRWIFKWIPFALKMHRFHIFLLAENDFRLFPMTKSAARMREKRRQKVEKYMRDTAPAKYHEILIPDFEVGCKRRIFDDGYLKSLHNEKLILTGEGITEVVPEGIKTDRGFIPADVIILATGFQTNKFLPYTQIQGRHRTIEDHWKQFGGPGAYQCSVMSGFPNFFLLLGPNAATGHTSAIMAAENSVNYALRVLQPVLQGDASSVDLKQEAENEYVYWVQNALRHRVWNAGCASWYLNENQWNAMAYPWTQAHYWYRSLFPMWSHWTIKKTRKPVQSRRIGAWAVLLVVVVSSVAFACIRDTNICMSIMPTMEGILQGLLAPPGSSQPTKNQSAEVVQ